MYIIFNCPHLSSLVLHDGVKPLPGAEETVQMLLDKKKRLIVLSNTSARRSVAQERLGRISSVFSRIEEVCTSGEAAWEYLHSRHSGGSCCWITWNDYRDPNRGTSYLEGLDMRLTGIDEADVLILHGTDMIVQGSSATDAVETSFKSTGALDGVLGSVLARAIVRRIPVVCANMDLVAVQGDGLIGHMPGALLEKYFTMGGQLSNVVQFGKPQAGFFTNALDRGSSMEGTEGAVRTRRPTALHIGDSLLHDIQGIAFNAGL